MAKQRYFLGCVFVVLAASCWGLIGLLGAKLNQAGFSGLEVASLRITLASVVLILVSPFVLESLRVFQRKQLPLLSMQSLLGVFLMTVCYFLAVQHIGAALSVALLYTAPVWSMLLANFVLKERMSLSGVMLTLITVVGVALCLNTSAPLNWTGIAFGLLSGFSYACFGVLGKKALNNTPPTILLYSSVLISGMTMLFMPFFHSAMQKMFTDMAPNIWMVALMIAVVGTLLPYTLYTKA